MIDILLATYNGEKFISEQIQSIINQTYLDWKLIIHDDGSTDETVKIIKRIQAEYPNKIKLINDQLCFGEAKSNFEHLLKLSLSKYIMFCDQDDVWDKNKIQLSLNKLLHLEKLNKNQPILVHTDLSVVDSKLNLINKSMWSLQKTNPEWSKKLNISLIQNSVTGCTIIMNQHAKEISLPIPQNAIMHDWWILLSVLKHNGTVDFLNISTIKYRQHNFNEVGAESFSLLKTIMKLSSIKKYKLMARELGINLSTVDIIYHKSLLTFNKLKGYNLIFFKKEKYDYNNNPNI